MSRLPRLHSSPDRLFAPSSSGLPTLPSMSNVTTRAKSVMGNSTNTLKRKAGQDDDDEALEAADQPRKLPAISSGIQRPGMGGPLRPSRTATNLPYARGNSGSSAVPQLSKSTSATVPSKTRATSAPPKSIGVVRPTVPPTRGKPPGSRSVPGGPAGPGVVGGLNDTRFQALQEQVSSIEVARAADAARLASEMEAERAKVAELQMNQDALSKELAAKETARRRELNNASEEIEELRRRNSREIEELQRRHAREVEELESDARRRERDKDREIRELKEDLRMAQDDLDRERSSVSSLKATVEHQATAHIALTTQVSSLQAQHTALKATLDCKVKDASELRLELEDSRNKVVELEEELREAETIRRKLHNTVQELKGNIRVFCRVRPLLPSDLPTELAQSISGSSLVMLSNPNSSTPEEHERIREEFMARIEFPDRRDHKEIVLSSSSENAMGQERKEAWNFTFDRVFEPASTQAEVFEEISQLAQSCVDGYNVCIFAYGQTGSGKSFTMEGGLNEETAGMIPRAVESVFRVAEYMRSKGWDYRMEGQFLEIYNETINDLLGKAEFDKKKHEIKHDKGTTRVTDAVVVPLSSASQVRTLLSIAQSRRTVASTLMNERSSRSHSVFTLRVLGTNMQSGESCEGSLNLVDLAGSERLNSSGAGNDKERLKETQNINKSLSALADVIAALGEKGEKADKHIPYRNSKLTYLLQNSLSGHSKTLMILNLSPNVTHLGESLCSLRFATKVNNTTLGTAKKQLRVST